MVASYLLLLVVWFIVIKHGYQKFQEPVGSSVIKIKGAGQVSSRNAGYRQDNKDQFLWDATEYTLPPIEDNAFFIVSRSLVTFKQTEDTCPTTLDSKLFCNSTDSRLCVKGASTNDGLGFLTGQCVKSSEDTTKTVCEINAWCPLENTKSTQYRINIDNLRNFTVFMKTAVIFSDAKAVIRTVNDNFNPSCRFNTATEVGKKCPIFSIGYILDNLKTQAGSINKTELYEQGGLILIEQEWECNLDTQKGRDDCFPTYTFILLQGGDEQSPSGSNYRFANKYRENGKDYRTLTKVFGLRFIVVITGKGGKFDILATSTTIQGNLELLGIITIICSIILSMGNTTSEQWKTMKTDLKSNLYDIVFCAD
ncbi:unnamed protein product [Rotaria sordida]|uniref:Purinergic receptor n=1 Tax=Rotaria sordida TaxID=392033 RepID=A0A815ID58_9BILA|nr:unnamed protein product [Rotaria sordida]CAF1608280.1 unnamed protein product [Rotaria sordida]